MKCLECEGSKKCKPCSGTGKLLKGLFNKKITTCHVCEGTAICTVCNGTGIIEWSRMKRGEIAVLVKCPKCNHLVSFDIKLGESEKKCNCCGQKLRYRL